MRESDLISRLNSGEEAAFAELFDAYAPAMLRTAFSLCGSSQDAEDAVQEVFVGMAKLRGRMTGILDLKSYVFACLRHATARRGRGPRVLMEQAEILEDLRSEPASSGLPEASALVEHALFRLPEEQRLVVAYRIDAGMTFEEIGQALGIRTSTAASRWRYAMEKLRRDLEGIRDHDRS